MKPDFTKNYYQILDLNKNSDPKQIRINYINLSKIWHPDISKLDNAKETFENIVEAYNILSKKQLKQSWDKYSIFGKDYTEEVYMNNFEFSNQGFEFNSFKSVIDKTKDERIHIILLLDKFQKIVQIERFMLCNNCDGTGHDYSKLAECLICKGDKKNKQGKDCFMCEGKGVIKSLECEMCNNTGAFNNKICRLCNGKGNISLSDCNACKSEGRIRVVERIEIKEEDFILEEEVKILVLKGKGHSSKLNIGIIGDLCIKIK